MTHRALFAVLVTTAFLSSLTAPARGADREDPATRTDRVETRALALRTHVAAELDLARVARDRLRARCLDRTLAEVHALLRLTWRQREAIVSGAGPRSPRADLAVSVLERRLGELRRSLRTCSGEPDVVADGRTVVVTTTDEDVPDVDPTIIAPPYVPGSRRAFER